MHQGTKPGCIYMWINQKRIDAELERIAVAGEFTENLIAKQPPTLSGRGEASAVKRIKLPESYSCCRATACIQARR